MGNFILGDMEGVVGWAIQILMFTGIWFLSNLVSSECHVNRSSQCSFFIFKGWEVPIGFKG